MRLAFAFFASAALASPAWAQMDHSKMPGMDMPAPEPAKPESTVSAPAKADPHAEHEMGEAAHPESPEGIGSAPAPVPPEDHAADALFDPADMAAARRLLRRENGGVPVSFVSFDLAEVQIRKGREGYRWEGESWFGGDIDRLTLKYEGEGAFGGSVDDAEFQALWSHAISPYWNLQAGLRQDIRPSPSRSYVALGMEGMAPYWFELAGTAFISNKGDVHARIEGYYDQRITQSLILQPRIEANFALQDVPELRIGSGLVDFEAGLRLRYEIQREFAPYIGVEWQTKAGGTARYARAAGEDTSSVNIVAGIRIWF
jgi:copper resistance protein B